MVKGQEGGPKVGKCHEESKEVYIYKRGGRRRQIQTEKTMWGPKIHQNVVRNQKGQKTQKEDQGGQSKKRERKGKNAK